MNPKTYVARFARSKVDSITPERLGFLEHARFVNNIVYWDGPATGSEFNVSQAVKDHGTGTFSISNNFWYDYILNSLPGYDTLSPTLDVTQQDPAFIDLINYKILTTSPAATNAGLGLYEITSDHPSRISCPGCALGYEISQYGSCFPSLPSTPSRGAHQAQ